MDITIPKGKILKLHGLPIELEQDIVVHSPTIEGYGGLEAFEAVWGADTVASEDAAAADTEDESA